MKVPGTPAPQPQAQQPSPEAILMALAEMAKRKEPKSG